MSENILYIENTKSKKLIVYFSSAAANTLEGISVLAKYQENKLFIRDNNRTWYNGEIPDISTSVEQLKMFLKKYVEKFKKKDIVFMGSSMGAYGALLFGIKLGIGKVIAISPQIVIDYKLPYTPPNKIEYENLSDLILTTTATHIDIWFGEEELLDFYHQYPLINSKSVSFYPVKGASHNIFYHFKERLLLEDFFDLYFSKKTFPYLLHDPVFMENMSNSFEKIAKAVKAMYIDENYETSLKILNSLKMERAPWAGLHYFTGLIYLRLNNIDKAIIEFKRTCQLQPYHHDAAYELGMLYLQIGNMPLSERAFALSVLHHPMATAQLYARLSETQRSQKKMQKSKSNALKAYAIDKNNLWARYQLVKLYDTEKNYKQSIIHCKFILQQKPDWKEIKELLFNALNTFYTENLLI